MTPRGSDRNPIPYAWLALGVVALAALAWACRGAPLGVAATDDYTFLAALRFHPLDWLGTMDAPYYWRPVGRQLYFSLVGPWMLAHPWGVVLLHGAILAGVFVLLERTARRAFSPPVAAMIAAFPLSAEAVRTFTGWASGGQHLLATLGVALAVHEAVAGRRVTAALAALAGILSHESAAFVVPALPVIAWFRTRRVRPALEWAAIALGVALVVWLGHEAARARGMALPGDGSDGLPWARLGEALVLAFTAALNLEDQPAAVTWTFGAAYALVAVAAVVVWMQGRARAPRRGALAAALGGAVWFVAGIAPLAIILPDWNAWRTVLPTVGFGFAAIGLVGLASARLAGALFAIHLVALVLAPAAPAVVTARPPDTRSHASFVRLVRIQRTVGSTREALTTRYPTLPSGTVVRYWLIPALTEVGFEGPRAVRVWYADSTLDWQPFDVTRGLRQPPGALVEYNAFEASPATVIERQAVIAFGHALDALQAGDLAAADDLLGQAFASQPVVSEPLFASLAHQRARVALALGDPARADSLNRLDLRWAGESARTFAVEAYVAAARGDRAAADTALRRCLTLEPGNPDAIALARDLGLIPAGP